MFWDTADIWKILQSSPGIVSLDIKDINGDPFRFPDPLPDSPNTTLPTLSTHGEMTVDGLLKLLGLFPNLSSLCLPLVGRPIVCGYSYGYPYWQPPSPAQEKLPLLPNPSVVGRSLRSLKAVLRDCDAVLRHLPNLKEVTQSGKLDKSLAMALTAHCPGFEVFRSSHHLWYHDEDEGEYVDPERLVDNPSLRVFDSIWHTIWVDVMLREPWTCLGLLTEEETAAVEKFRRCQRQHYGVYNQLARLTRLRHLDLGREVRTSNSYDIYGEDSYEKNGQRYLQYSGPTFDTLEPSLRSRLDRLAALKSLEMFGLECLNHLIGRSELEWMVVSWLHLRMMDGLVEQLYKIEPNQERITLKEYFEQLIGFCDLNHMSHKINSDNEKAALKDYFVQLRPDVVHDNLYMTDF
ncbi:hypothetical protein BGX29_006368 [Mortierella sp. GBA35]|nr:hypothetical protein BGX29_006368 [Mortierella sp. GBA35]